MADTDGASEPVFRTNKRRKVFRKRADSNPEDAGAGAGDAEDRLNSTEAGQPEENGESSLRFQRRVGVKKRGIGFASTGGRRAGPPEDNQETAVVPTALDATQEMQIERFVRPTGREMVTEDKHMMAYIDSKLAEMRSSAASPANHTDLENGATAPMTETETEEARASVPARSEERSFNSAQARSDRVYQRPAKRPRKKRYERGEEDIARDAYIEQFMQEAQVPLYDRSTSTAAVADEGGDNDAATAEAFKAQLLADMEMHRRRPPKSASAQTATTASGPKLGGSRQQREKMRALQEAEGKK